MRVLCFIQAYAVNRGVTQQCDVGAGCPRILRRLWFVAIRFEDKATRLSYQRGGPSVNESVGHLFSHCAYSRDDQSFHISRIFRSIVSSYELPKLICACSNGVCTRTKYGYTLFIGVPTKLRVHNIELQLLE